MSARPNYPAHAAVFHTICTGSPDLRNATIDHMPGESVRALDHLHRLALKHDRIPAEHKKAAQAVVDARTLEHKRAALKRHHKVTRAITGGYLSGMHRSMRHHHAQTGQTGEGFWHSLWDGVKDVGKAALPVVATALL